METSKSILWVLLFFAMTIVTIRSKEEGNGNALAQSNDKSLTSVEHSLASEHERKNKTYNDVEVSNKNRNNGGGGGGWGWRNGGGEVGGGGGGGGGGSGSNDGGSMGGGGGWGWGGGGGGWWGWGCRKSQTKNRGMRRVHGHKRRAFGNEDYRIGEFAQCMGKGRCKGMRLDCPLHCGGPCFYDCKNMCKAHCRR